MIDFYAQVYLNTNIEEIFKYMNDNDSWACWKADFEEYIVNKNYIEKYEDWDIILYYNPERILSNSFSICIGNNNLSEEDTLEIEKALMNKKLSTELINRINTLIDNFNSDTHDYLCHVPNIENCPEYDSLTYKNGLFYVPYGFVDGVNTLKINEHIDNIDINEVGWISGLL